MTAMSRALVYLRRIAAALDRAYPPPPTLLRQRVRPDFSVSTVADFDRGWDERIKSDPAPDDAGPRPFKEEQWPS